MPNTPRLRWPYPRKDADPWFEEFVALSEAQDATAFAAIDNAQTILMGGGNIDFDDTDGELSWSAALVLSSFSTGFVRTVAPATVTVLDGEMLYVSLPRNIINNQAVTPHVAATRPNDASLEEFFVLCIRRGAKLYWRNGAVIPAETFGG